MSGVKVSQLPVLTNAATHSGDSFPIVDSASGELKQMALGQLDLRYQGVPDGGTTQQVLAKASGTNKDVYWKTLDKNSVGLGLVDNTSDANKPISNATQAALNLKANTSALSSYALTSTVNSQIATKQDKLPTGTDGEVLTLVAGVPTWQAGGGGPGAVTSVFGRTGTVTAQTGDYDKTMIGLDQVDNTSDLDKPISNLTAIALSGKQASLPAGTNGQILSLAGGSPTWINQPSVSPLTNKGDVYTHNGTSNQRLAVGTSGQILTADSSSANGVKWADAPTSYTAVTFGTWASPLSISSALGGGFSVSNSNMSSTADDQIIFVKGSAAGRSTLMANIEGHTKIGKTMCIVGASSSDSFEMTSGAGVILNGPWQSGYGNTLTLRSIDSSTWIEVGRT